MKKLLFAFTILIGFSATAQTDSLDQYVGKFRFPDGSPVTEISVVLENGVLTGTSAMGNSEFRKTDSKDVFDVVAYSGTATFRRGEDGKVKMLRIQVQDIDMEGTKESLNVEFFPQLLFSSVKQGFSIHRHP
jgi:hypothetical protein